MDLKAIIEKVIKVLAEGFVYQGKFFSIILSPFYFKEDFYNIYIKIWKFSIGITLNYCK